MNLGTIVALSLMSLTSCGQHKTASSVKIVGGSLVESTSEIAQFTVSLVRPGRNSSFCSGTLIDTRHVLTAAHCVRNLAFTPVVAFGLTTTSAKIIGIKASFANLDFDEQQAMSDFPNAPVNDVGVIELNEDAPATALPAKVLEENAPLDEGEDFILAGFGRTEAEDDTSAGNLRNVTTKISKLAVDRKEIEYGGIHGKSACVGDSGGPALVMRSGKLVLAGVASRGSSECDEAGFFTDVRFFNQWIIETKSRL